MPGVFENTAENVRTLESSIDLTVANNQVNQNVNNGNGDEKEPIAGNNILNDNDDDMKADDDDDDDNVSPVRELTQTDKINRYMLKSFLEHMNQQLPHQQFTSESSTNTVDNVDSIEDNEWWSPSSYAKWQIHKFSCPVPFTFTFTYRARAYILFNRIKLVLLER